MQKLNFLKQTLVFSVVGLFIPGFTAMALLGFQMMLSFCGLECYNAWIVIWTVSVLGGLALPVFFYRHIKSLPEMSLRKLKTQLIFFNLIEYILIQASLAFLFTSGSMLCYGSDGQNGLELVFSAWFALPILILFSFMFGKALKAREEISL